MDCDQAFDCLTDSRRRHSAELERHLAACPRCRQMHDTLEPALDLFDCVVEEPDLSGLAREPRATGQPESLRVAEQTAARLFAAGTPGRRGSDWHGFLRYTTVFVCGAVVVLALGAAQQRFGPDFSPRSGECLFQVEGPDRWRAMSNAEAIAACQRCHSESTRNRSNDAVDAERTDRALFQQVSRAGQSPSVWLALADWRRLIGRSPTRETTGWRAALASRHAARRPEIPMWTPREERRARVPASLISSCGAAAASLGSQPPLESRADIRPLGHPERSLAGGVSRATWMSHAATTHSQPGPDLQHPDSARSCA